MTIAARPVLDDFAEFLTVTYRDLLDGLNRAGMPARVERADTGRYVVSAVRCGREAVLTDRGGPIPPDPADADMWFVHESDAAPAGLPVTGSVDAVVCAFARFLAPPQT